MDILLKCFHIMSVFLLYLIRNIIYIAFYGSALLIALDNSTPGVVIFCITSHLILAILFVDIVLKRIVHIETTTVLNLIYRLLIVAVIIVVLIVRDHWYLASITLLSTILSAKFNWKCKN